MYLKIMFVMTNYVKNYANTIYQTLSVPKSGT